ncbi:MAG: hypothetical protein JWN30_1594 [Bacilli bacterium]|nr:hypothetical protein [Bacilli bacterium]
MNGDIHSKKLQCSECKQEFSLLDGVIVNQKEYSLCLCKQCVQHKKLTFIETSVAPYILVM